MVKASTPELLEKIRQAELAYEDSRKRFKERRKMGNIGQIVTDDAGKRFFEPKANPQRKVDGVVVFAQCIYCEADITHRRKSKDHLIPRSRGGSGCAENKMWCCYSCNQDKGNLLLEEWVVKVGAVVDRYQRKRDIVILRNVKKWIEYTQLNFEKMIIANYNNSILSHRKYFALGQELKKRYIANKINYANSDKSESEVEQ